MASILESAREDRRTSQIPHDISCSGVASSPRMIKPIEYLRSRSDERLEYGDTLSSCPDFSLSKRIDIYKGAPAKIENIWVIHFYTCLPCQSETLELKMELKLSTIQNKSLLKRIPI